MCVWREVESEGCERAVGVVETVCSLVIRLQGQLLPVRARVHLVVCAGARVRLIVLTWSRLMGLSLSVRTTSWTSSVEKLMKYVPYFLPSQKNRKRSCACENVEIASDERCDMCNLTTAWLVCFCLLLKFYFSLQSRLQCVSIESCVRF